MKGYKGFAPGLICRGKQYAENTVFEEKEANVCENGMHFCVNPFEVLNFYPLIDKDGNFNEFAEVEALAKAKTDDEKKYCTTKLKIGAKLSFAGFVRACVDFLFEKTKVEEAPNVQASSGDSAQMASSGDYAQMASSGDYAQMASSGDYAQMASSGYYAQMASSGDYAQMASSGDYAQMASSGYYAQMASSGDYAQMASSGYYAQMASSGYYAQMASSGYSAVLCCAGMNGKAKAKKGSWITLAEWKYDYDLERYVPVCVKTEQVDGERIKEDTFYTLENGEFVEC